MDEGSVDIFLDVRSIDTAGGQELQTHKGSGQVLHGIQTAVDIGGEELDHLQTMLQSGHDLGGSDAAGGNGNVVFYTPCHHLFAVAGGNDELGAHFHCQLALLQVHDGAGTDQNIGAVFSNSADGFRCAGGAEGDLHGVNTAGSHGLGSGDSILDLVQNHDGDDDRVRQSA